MTKKKTPIKTTLPASLEMPRGKKAIGTVPLAPVKIPAKARRVAAVPAEQVGILKHGHVIVDMSEADLNKLADKVAARTQPKCNEFPAERSDVGLASDSNKKESKLEANHRQVETQMNALEQTLKQLGVALAPVMSEDVEADSGEPSQVEWMGGSSANEFLRNTARCLETLNARMKHILRNLEI